jgi:hypothetical protein
MVDTLPIAHMVIARCRSETLRPRVNQPWHSAVDVPSLPVFSTLTMHAYMHAFLCIISRRQEVTRYISPGNACIDHVGMKLTNGQNDVAFFDTA